MTIRSLPQTPVSPRRVKRRWLRKPRRPEAGMTYISVEKSSSGRREMIEIS
jgi:hypothetical protein